MASSCLCWSELSSPGYHHNKMRCSFLTNMIVQAPVSRSSILRKCYVQNIIYSILTSCVRTQQWVECDCQFPRLYWFQVLSGSALLVSRHISQLSGTKFPVGVWEFESILQLQEERRGVIRRRNWWKLFATYLTNWRAPQHLAYASSWTLPASWIRGIRIWHLGSYRRHEAIIGKS